MRPYRSERAGKEKGLQPVITIDRQRRDLCPCRAGRKYVVLEAEAQVPEGQAV